MVRRNGEYTDKQRRRDYPHDVEFAVTSCGTDHARRYEAMIRWCAERAGRDGFAMTSRHDQEIERDYIQFRFKDPTVADEFRRTWALPVRTSDEAEVYKAAALMVKRHGADAAKEADKRAKLLLSRNEHAFYATLRMISGVIVQLQRARESGESVD